MRRDEEVLPARLGDPGGQEPGLPHVPLASDWHVERKVKSLSRVQLFATPWTVSYQAPLSMEFSRREYWSEVPLPSAAAAKSEVQNQGKLNRLDAL